MHTEVIRFDSVLHVHRNPHGSTSPKHTVFSFMADGRYTPYVTVHGWPRLEPGMTVTAVLEQPDDRRSLIGWVDHATGERAGPDTLGLLARLLTTTGVAMLAIAIGLAHMWAGNSTVGMVAVAGLGLAGFAVQDLKRLRSARAAWAELSCVAQTLNPG